jgi:hypothetical protein
VVRAAAWQFGSLGRPLSSAHIAPAVGNLNLYPSRGENHGDPLTEYPPWIIVSISIVDTILTSKANVVDAQHNTVHGQRGRGEEPR